MRTTAEGAQSLRTLSVSGVHRQSEEFMTPSMLAPARHADRILDVVQRGVRHEISDVVVHSWKRCLNDYRLDPEQSPQPMLFGGAAMDARCGRVADIIDSARHEMTTLFQQLGDPLSAVVLTDTDGVILHLVSSARFAAELEPLRFVVGAMWSEPEAGTNGMGTCLAAQEPISVQQEDHFFTRFTSLTCSAVPVYDPMGHPAAVLDVTSRSNLMQQHVLVLLGMTARMIENRLLDQRFRHAHPLHFHSRPEFVYTLHEGRLVVADDGSILAANRSALFQLGLASIDAVRSHRIDEIFQTTLADMLQRSSDASFHPVVTYRVNGAHRFFAVARQPAGTAGASRSTSPRAAQRAPPPLARPAALARSTAALARSNLPFADPQWLLQFDIARRVVARGTPVLLRGETGSGKEVFARALHERSPGSCGSFVAVNCASLPESLIEAELFGYRAGAFTGAQRSGRRGRILQADGGTLFLDEIGDMPVELQARLLRVLDERQVTPLGTEETQTVDFQLVSASHRDLAHLVHDGRFREDLYYRLAGVELHLPPLRERADRRELIRSILAEEAGSEARLAPEAEQLLMDHPWPGNLRQLRHVLRSAGALADAGMVGIGQMEALRAPPERPRATPTGDAVQPPAVTAAADESACPQGLNLFQVHERQVLLQLLEQHRWNVSHVAKTLQVSRNTLYRKLHRLQIPVVARF
jgi:transcriptional regulator of acetoin/glycerol metabolism